MIGFGNGADASNGFSGTNGVNGANGAGGSNVINAVNGLNSGLLSAQSPSSESPASPRLAYHDLAYTRWQAPTLETNPSNDVFDVTVRPSLPPKTRIEQYRKKQQIIRTRCILSLFDHTTMCQIVDAIIAAHDLSDSVVAADGENEPVADVFYRLYAARGGSN